MRIKQISVTKLFGVFDHTIPLNMDERITIIHGPNGFGKTILLRMVDGLFNSRYSELRKIPFYEFRVNFDDGKCFKIQKSIESSDTNLTFELSQVGSKPKTFSPPIPVDTEEISFPLGLIGDIVPELARIERTRWLYVPTKEELSLEGVLERFSNRLPLVLTQPKKEPKWLSEFKKAMNIRLIQAQRLLSLSDVRIRGYSKGTPMVPSVASYSEQLAENLQEKLAEYGALSQSLDRTFPARVVNQKAPSHLTDSMLRNKLSEIEEKRSSLRNVGLLDKDENPDFQVKEEIDETTKNILSVYLEDVEKKLAVFKDTATRIELFQRIITERFKYKTITISKEKGFTFTAANGKPLSPTDLSSGEQHELVLLYELLFKVKPNSLILIDEPELSFHVGWQVKFIKDLQEIIRLADFDVLMATHSPDIISDRWDLTVELKGPAE